MCTEHCHRQSVQSAVALEMERRQAPDVSQFFPFDSRESVPSALEVPSLIAAGLLMESCCFIPGKPISFSILPEIIFALARHGSSHNRISYADSVEIDAHWHSTGPCGQTDEKVNDFARYQCAYYGIGWCKTRAHDLTTRIWESDARNVFI